MPSELADNDELLQLSQSIKQWGIAAGFQHVGISDIDLSHYEPGFLNWLEKGYHGEMDYMQRHGVKRSRPAELLPGTIRVISFRMNYFPADTTESWAVINNKALGYLSRYALGRDYHKLMRKRLQKVAKKIEQETASTNYRVFVDSAPVLEKAIAEKSGLGWIGKHTNVLTRDAGSWFFLGEIYIDAPLPVDQPASNHCGECSSCIDICPTNAIIAPYQLDARKCISYLTIELRGSIPLEFREKIGNRIYGCDDCQLVCPWNRFSQHSGETDFSPRHQLDAPELLTLFSWTEAEFLSRTEGSPIRRIGYECWQRNIAVALGNGDGGEAVLNSLSQKREEASEMVTEHIDWAITQLHGNS